MHQIERRWVTGAGASVPRVLAKSLVRISGALLGSRLAVATLLTLMSCLPALAQQDTLLMPDGAYAATIKAGLAPGETRIYYLKAEQGQQLTAKLESAENNGYLTISDSAGQSLLSDLPESTQVQTLDIVLPSAGKYTLAVGAREGQCSYTLEVTLAEPSSSDLDETQSF